MKLIYPYDGTYKRNSRIDIKLTVPNDSGGTQLYLKPDLFENNLITVIHDYKRVIINVTK